MRACFALLSAGAWAVNSMQVVSRMRTSVILFTSIQCVKSSHCIVGLCGVLIRQGLLFLGVPQQVRFYPVHQVATVNVHMIRVCLERGRLAVALCVESCTEWHSHCFTCQPRRHVRSAVCACAQRSYFSLRKALAMASHCVS